MQPTSVEIKLRAPEPEDLDILYVWENDPEIWNVSNTITPFSRFILSKYIENAHLDVFQTRQLRLMIDVSVSGTRTKTVGAIDLFDFEPLHLRAGVGILIGDVSDRKKGYADKALKHLIHYSFNTLLLNQLYCNISIDNQISMDLFQKNGFEKIGVKRLWNKTSKGYSDEVMLQLISPLSLY
jgi:diamine N-acetyltransferase